MTTLLRKDWRVNRVPAVGSAIVIVGVYLLPVIAEFTRDPTNHGYDLLSNVSNSALLGMWLTVFMSAVYGATAFAVERRERSAEFLAMLPVSRRSIVFSKAVVAVAAPLAMWLLHYIVLDLSTLYSNFWGWENVHLTAALAVMTFGIAWMLSTFLTSPAISATIAIGAAFAMYLTMATWYDGSPEYRRVHLLIMRYAVLTGATSFLIGILYYLRRIEP